MRSAFATPSRALAARSLASARWSAGFLSPDPAIDGCVVLTARKHMYLAGQSAGTFATLVCTLGIAGCGGAMSSTAAPRSREGFSGIHGRFLSGYKQGYKPAKNRVKNARPDGLLRGRGPRPPLRSGPPPLRRGVQLGLRPSCRTGLFSVGGSNCLFPIGWHRMSNTSLCPFGHRGYRLFRTHR